MALMISSSLNSIKRFNIVGVPCTSRGSEGTVTDPNLSTIAIDMVQIFVAKNKQNETQLFVLDIVLLRQIRLRVKQLDRYASAFTWVVFGG